MPFTGIPADVFRFYEELAANNTRDWWAENGWAYRETVLPTMTDLLEELDDRWFPMSVFRPYRNVRFSPDKTPYKSVVGAVGADIGATSHYLQISGSGMMASRGAYVFSWDQLQRYMLAVHEDEDNELDAIVMDLMNRGYHWGGWDRVSTAPQGYSRYHVRIEYLRLGGITLSMNWPADHGWLGTRRSLSLIQDAWAGADPLAEWLAQHVGPPSPDGSV